MTFAVAGVGLLALPTTLAGHAFWRSDDAGQSAQQRGHFAKNIAIVGGLILAALPCADDN